MKVVKIDKNTPAKVFDAVLKTPKANEKSGSNIAKEIKSRMFSSDCSDALCTLERNAQLMTPEEYINARTYLSSIEYDRLCFADLK